MEISKNIKVGIFVLIGTGFLIVALYLIGTKQNLFGSTFELQAKFKNVNGLMTGNNVRFTGIDVGTVKGVEIINDSTVNVVMVIETKVKPFIKKNAVASVGSDGLMGNKLINISSSDIHAPIVEDGDNIIAINSIGTDAMMRTLDASNQNIKAITEDIKTIASRLNKPNTLWTILSDTTVAENLKQAVSNINSTGERASLIANDIRGLMTDVKSGKGTVGKLLMDTVFSQRLDKTMMNVQSISDTFSLISDNLKSVSKNLKNGNGAVGTVLSDTSFSRNLNQSMLNIKDASSSLNENMEALRYSWPFKKYFKKQKKTGTKK